jgi:amino acid transporter
MIENPLVSSSHFHPEIVADESLSSSHHKDSTAVDDEQILASMGYKQELDRGLGAFMNFAFGFTEVSVLASISSVYSYGLATGGPVVIFWGWVITFAATMVVAYSMGEICAAYPSAGSVYHWAGMITPIRYRPAASYICGWANFLGNAAGDAAFAYSWATFIGAAAVAGGGEALTVGAQVGISILILTVWTSLNFFNVATVGWVNNGAAILQISSVFILLIGLLAAANSLNTAEYVLTAYNNDTGWSSRSYVCAIGLLTSLFGFSGYEASAHMAEETVGSRTAAPYGIINTCWATGIVGLFYIIALLFTTTNISSATDDGLTEVAAVNVFLSACGNDFGNFLAWLIVINLFFAGVSSVTVTGRITFALVRDGAFPYSDYWSKVNETTKAPVRALIFVYIFDTILLLLPLASTVAFDSIVGIATIGFDVSYGIPIFLKLLFNYDSFPSTPMSLGWKSNLFNVIAVCWLFGTSILLFLPTENPITANNMNYTVLVVSMVAISATVYWFAYAKDNFRGPGQGKGDIVIPNSPSAAREDKARLI